MSPGGLWYRDYLSLLQKPDLIATLKLKVLLKATLSGETAGRTTLRCLQSKVHLGRAGS